jgi:signal transduction histidine kinase
VCAPHLGTVPTTDLRRRFERLDRLPLRPISARQYLNAIAAEPRDAPASAPESSRFQAAIDTDPGWVLERMRPGRAFQPLTLIANCPWWKTPSGTASEALSRQWRHAVAVSQAARRLAREADDPDFERVAGAGLLHGIGRWAVAALDPDWLTTWFTVANPRLRRELEHRSLGSELTTLGRILAERWGCDPLVVDAAWLHADRERCLNGCASDSRRLAFIQEAFARAERTPWAIGTSEFRETGLPDPRVRVLIAEVQVRCGSAFIEPDATPHEERLSRLNAQLLRQQAGVREGVEARDRFLNALAESDPAEGPEIWAERAGLAWCGERGVATTRVVWSDARGPAPTDGSSRANRPATWVIPLTDRGRSCVEVHLWADSGHHPPLDNPTNHPARAAWQAWAAIVADRARVHQRLETVLRAHGERVATEEPRLRQAKLEALAEFAAGAGHELNNPLAVIVGRAQLLLAQETDPVAIRSLRAILGQAQRAHRILRDLMYIARPPEPRPRFCQPGEIVRTCLRDFKAEAEARGLRLFHDGAEGTSKVWADHDALRHLIEILVRNALESTPKGGKVRVTTSGDAHTLRWTVQDNGRGISATEGQHLFDPFYCGRQAGRGLGLGLPRAARIVAQAGGELRWHSRPGQGSVFQVHLPLGAPPKPPESEAEIPSLTPQSKTSVPGSP